MTLSDESDPIVERDLHNILPPDRYAMKLRQRSDIVQKGTFQLLNGELGEFVAGLDRRLSSLFMALSFDIAWVRVDCMTMLLFRGSTIHEYVKEECTGEPLFCSGRSRIA